MSSPAEHFEQVACVSQREAIQRSFDVYYSLAETLGFEQVQRCFKPDLRQIEVESRGVCTVYVY